jgi:metallopeptidase family M12-like protein
VLFLNQKEFAVQTRFLFLALSLTISAPLAAGPLTLRSFDAASARPAEVAREARASAPGTLFRISGLQGAEGEALTLDLETAALFAPDFHLYVDGQDRGHEIVSRLALLRGTVEEWPRSSVALTINGETGAWSGSVVAGDRLYEITLPAGTAQGPIAKSAVVRQTTVDPVAKNSLTDVLEPPAGLAKALQGNKAVIVPPGSEFQATIAIESDYELFALYGNVDAVTDYLTSLIAGVSELYFRQIGVSLTISSLSVYTSENDPWNAPNPHSGATADVLCEFSNFWQRFRPVKSYPRNGAVFFTGKSSADIGGQAWRSSLCNYTSRPSSCPFGGYGIVVVTKRKGTDTFVTAHELGHEFGSRHTHCYSPPIDQCFGTEQGCYAGPETTPDDGGSVMSYCSPRNLSLGEPGKYGLDSQRVEDVIRGFVDTVGPSCLVVTSAPFGLKGEGAPGSATLTWTDPFGNESNWLVEQRQSNGKFKQVKSLPPNTTSVTLTKLKPGPNAFRVRAKVKKDFSVYSEMVTVTVP